MKKHYVTPELTLFCFNDDVITNSINTYLSWNPDWDSYNGNLFD